MDNTDILSLTADIVAAHVSNNNVSTGDVPALIKSTFEALNGLGKEAEPEPVKLEPAVSVRSSVKPDYITCLECGSKQKMLKRHLMTAHDESPQEYRAKWGLSADYPLVAPNYAEQRRSLAHRIGLGRKRKAPEPEAPKPTRRPRAKKSAPAEA